MNEDEIKQKKLQEMMNQQQNQQQAFEERKRQILLNILTKNARERLGRISIVKPETANQIEAYLIQLYQSGQLKRKLTEEDLKNILSATQDKKDFKIKRK